MTLGLVATTSDSIWNLTIGGETVSSGLLVWEWAQGNPYHSPLWSKRGVVFWNRLSTIWLVVEYDTAERHRDKVLVSRCKTVAVSTSRVEMVNFIQKHGGKQPSLFEAREAGDGASVKVGFAGKVKVGHNGSAIAGCFGSAYAGDGGYAKAGTYGGARAGADGTAVAGKRGVASAGIRGIARVGYRGEAEAYGGGTATAGTKGIAKVHGGGGAAISGRWGLSYTEFEGKSITGDWGRASAGSRGIAIAGAGGIAIVGTKGKAKAGKGGTLIFDYPCGGFAVASHVFKVGEGGIKPDTFYKLDESGKPIETAE